MVTRRNMIAGGAALAASATLAAPAIAQKAHRWRIQTLWQAGTVNQQAFERFCENVKAMTDGRLQITALASGAAVGQQETLDAVSRGLLDGHHPATVYWTGRNPAFGVIGDLNGAYDNPYQAQDYFENYGGLDLLKEIYKPFKIYPIGVAWWGMESIPVSRPVRGPEDLKGLKMRLPQGMSADIFAKFGVVAVNLPGTEVFSGLDRGVIEAADWGTLGMNAEIGLHEKAKWALFPGFHSMPVGDVSVNQDRWDALTPDLKAILTVGVRDFCRDMIQSVARQDAATAVALAEKKVELIAWTPEGRRKFRTTAEEVWQQYAQKNELCKKAVDGQVAYLKSRGLIG
ncbi:TRAP transporter substrate-binding protein [Xanthobacter tagetidis]|uniref:TRAP transporter substrate-binding protein n=1 Tax=Xanthobacter tagetidis TaxID=60216 RepID=A0A3L7AB00_9HYPH|nr:TRAP transporter substrate-binding protein [Xanthobacter tagetidis]MBB6309591.1 TRAP-type mannitol/chloroaromatic compound transport system substrate-binding protein [Xanthobacter tagetidis]RLP77144.1 TRAP transporter substrate-binding protein [Xanthobacter tagetidis]